MDGIFSNPNHLRLLQELLSPEDDDNNETVVVKKTTQNNPVLSANQAHQSTASSSVAAMRTPADDIRQPQTIEEWERQEEQLNDNILDHRARPHYDIVYKQAVRPEDIYLQMGNKTPATASCEEMTIQISMPNEVVDIDRMQLDVAANSIDLQTPKYRLNLPLVQAIDPDKGRALWDADKQVLTLVLVMEREFDYVNF